MYNEYVNIDCEVEKREAIDFVSKKKYFDSLVSVCSIVALILQCIELPEPFANYTHYIAWAVIVLSVVSLGFDVYTRRREILKGQELNKMTRKLLLNTSHKVVFMGGDLSWAAAYLDTIRRLTQEGKSVEIFFALDRVIEGGDEAVTRFEMTRRDLKNAGAVLYSCIVDHHLRCVLVDVEANDWNSSTCICLSERIVTTENQDHSANRYRTRILRGKNREDMPLINSYRLNYELLKKNVDVF